MAEGRRRTFGPVVLLGLAAGALTAVAGDRPAADASGKGASAASGGFVTYDAHLPVVTALGLVVLACWGVVLVTRGKVRRTVAALGTLASVGALVAVVLAFSQVPDQLRDELQQVGVTDAAIGHTGWYWAAGVGAVLSVAATALAAAWVPDWPEMGSRYDAPGAAASAVEPATDPSEQSSLDLWKAMDEGRDPTAGNPE
jgi:uncharacterized membrane protein (TIGR02234 family)